MAQEAKPKQYVCPKCNVIVGEPIYQTAKKNEPKCANLHSLGEVQPFGQTLAMFLGIMLIFTPVYYWLTGFLPAISPALSVVMFVLRLGILCILVMGIVEIVKGIGYSQKAEPTKRLASGSIGQGIGMLFGTIGGILIIYLFQNR